MWTVRKPTLLDLPKKPPEIAVHASKIIDDVSARISAALADSPARDVDKNVRALLTGALARLDLVTREEFDVQAQVLRRTREKLEALTTRLAELEAQRR